MSCYYCWYFLYIYIDLELTFKLTLLSIWNKQQQIEPFALKKQYLIHFFFYFPQVMSSQEDDHVANDNTPISPPNVEVVSDTK